MKGMLGASELTDRLWKGEVATGKGEVVPKVVGIKPHKPEDCICDCGADGECCSN